MDKIYLDNGSTSFPKAPGLGDKIKEYIEDVGVNISRGGYENAYSLEEKILETRELISDFFNFGIIQNVCFTPSVTYALNFIIKGLLKKGDHLIISGMEHNAVYRSASSLEDVELSITKCDSEGFIDIENFKSLFKENTKLVVICYASNVSGTVQDIETIGKICREKNVFLCLDAAQGAGVIECDFKKFNLNALCVPAHKGLLGPQGLGVMMVDSKISKEINPVIFGGTGSMSDRKEMPDFLPDRFEPGTLNLPGIIGLNHSLKYVINEGRENILGHELKLAKLFIDEISKIDSIRIVGTKDFSRRVGVVSLDFLGRDNADISYKLDEKYRVMTRCGLHCAPLAHISLNTYPKGTVRFSFGYFNTESDVIASVNAIKEIIK